MSAFAAIHQRIAAAMQEAQAPGVALGVVQQGRLVHAQGFGITSAGEGGLPIMPDTLFQLGSTTKLLTGTMIMRLVAAGVLDLDRALTDYLPTLTLAELGVAAQLTLRHLLSHTAGLPWDQITPTRLYGRRDPTGLADYVRDELPHRPLLAPPGTRFEYSNPGINLAAHIAEVATGQPYPALVQSLVAEPLAMTRTTFDPTVALAYPAAQSHLLAPDGTISVLHRAPDNTAQYPAAFAYSTVRDLANFALLHLQQGRFGEVQLLPPALIALMHQPQIACSTGPWTGYGLTCYSGSYRGQRTVGHPGGIASQTCQFTLLPDLGHAVILLCNRGDTFPAEAIVEAVFALLL